MQPQRLLALRALCALCALCARCARCARCAPWHPPQRPARRSVLAGLVVGHAAGLAALVPLGAQALGSAAPFAAPRVLLDERAREAAGSAAAAPVASAASAAPAATSASAARPGEASASAAASPAPAEGIAGVRLGAQTLALIDGRWWPLGARLRGARLLAIDRQGALLQHADGRIERLLLAPPLRAAAAANAAAAAASRPTALHAP